MSINIDGIDFYNEDTKGKVDPFTIDQLCQVISQLKKNICKIYKIDGKRGTGFTCKMPIHPDQFNFLPVLITNYHVLKNEDLQINKTIKITFDNDKIEKTLLIDEKRTIFTNKNIDISIIEINPILDDIHDFLYIDESIYDNNYIESCKNKSIYILHYPKGEQPSCSSGFLKEINNKEIRHLCSTDYGSSGSPILSICNLRVIGVHKKRTDEEYNEGTFIKYVIEEFNKVYHSSNNVSKNNINNIKNSQEKDINLNNTLIEFNNFKKTKKEDNNVINNNKAITVIDNEKKHKDKMFGESKYKKMIKEMFENYDSEEENDLEKEEKTPILFIRVTVKEGIQKKIFICEGDKPEELADKFTKENNLDQITKKRLEKHLYNEMVKYGII